MRISIDNISGIVLAGGEGKRFNNRDKGFIELNDKPLIEYVINAITPQLDDIVISANRNTSLYSRYADIVIKDDANDFRGPLSGIASSIPHCKHEWVLVVPCDMPYFPDGLVDKMAAPITTHSLSIVRNNDQLQLVLLLNVRLYNSIKQALDNNQPRLLEWVKSQDCVVVDFHESTMFNNINTQEELSQLT